MSPAQAGTVRFSGRVIFCTDTEASARFYEEVLGFQRDWAGGSDINLRAAVTGSPDATVSILLHQGDNPAPVDVGMFDVDDVNVLVEKVRTAGYRVGFEPRNAPWGVREASVTDPDGHSLYLTSPL